MAQVSGAKYRSQKAILHEYVRKKVIGEVYPAITLRAGGSVEGVIYYDVSSVSFERLDKFEGSLYLRTGVSPLCESGICVAAETYVIAATAVHQLSMEDWSYERFQSKAKMLFQHDYPGYDKLT